MRICPSCHTRYEGDVAFCVRDGTPLQLDRRGESFIGRVLADTYRIERRIGEGGMARVFLAHHTRMGRPAAVKIIREGLIADPDMIARFKREASTASQIMHPNVAAIFDFGDAGDGYLFLAMEYVEGEPLSALLDREGRLPPRRAAGIAWQVADALTAAHDLGIIHRDLKPENVMLGRHREGSDLAKVVDFGVARIAGASGNRVTSTGIVIGTQDYMSPEQLAGESLDARSDVYALGILAFHMLTGRRPFHGRTHQEALLERLQAPPPRLESVVPDVAWPQALQDVLDIALAVNPEQRYEGAAELASDLISVVLVWHPDNEAAAEPWNQRLRYATPVRVKSFTPPGFRSPA